MCPSWSVRSDSRCSSCRRCRRAAPRCRRSRLVDGEGRRRARPGIDGTPQPCELSAANPYNRRSRASFVRKQRRCTSRISKKEVRASRRGACATLDAEPDGLRRVRTAGFEGAVRDRCPGDGGACRLPRSDLGAHGREAPRPDGRARHAERADQRRRRRRVRLSRAQADLRARRWRYLTGASADLDRRFVFPDVAPAPEPGDGGACSRC